MHFVASGGEGARDDPGMIVPPRRGDVGIGDCAELHRCSFCGRGHRSPAGVMDVQSSRASLVAPSCLRGSIDVMGNRLNRKCAWVVPGQAAEKTGIIC